MRSENWGLISYEEGLARQLETVERLISSAVPDDERLVFCSHPPVVTVGRATQEGDIFAWNGPLVEVSRGGRATYHGPNQLVIYPILDLNRRGRDLHKYLRVMEETTITVLKHFGVQARQEAGSTGVWVGERKIASIGVAVKRWITYHGLALNLDFDATAFQGLNPCGFRPQTMVCLEEILGHPVDRDFVIQLFEMKLNEALSNLDSVELESPQI